MTHFLTPAAERVLKRATQFAHAGDCAAVEPVHLLHALLREESRASEVLNREGIDSLAFAAVFPICDAADDLDETLSVQIPRSAAVEKIVQQARHQAAFQGQHAETGTEHLLWAFIAVDSPEAAWLLASGLKIEELSELISPESEAVHEPLETDVTFTSHEQPRSPAHDVLRMIDAAANRAREGIRAVEDYVRFALDDVHLTKLLKTWRHDFTIALRSVGGADLIAARETQADVGTTVTTTAESHRASMSHVVRANLKRAQEATRTIEEYGKLLGGELAGHLEKLRYRLYTLEKAVLTTAHNRDRLADRRLYLLVTEALCHHGSGPAIRGALAGGVGVVQLREKEMSDRRLVEFGRRVRAWTREAGALFIMNDRPDLAVLTAADGVHVGQDELSVREARRIVGADKLVGVSTHNIQQARQAVLDGADYLGVGPTFPSRTKQFDDFAGLEFVREVAAEITLPFFPIGGIDCENIAGVVAAGATRVAVTGAICGAEHPEEAARQLASSLHGGEL